MVYPNYWLEIFRKQWQWASMYLRLRRLRMMYLSIKRDPKNRAYGDLALTPIDDEEIATRELFRNEAAQAYVSQEW